MDQLMNILHILGSKYTFISKTIHTTYYYFGRENSIIIGETSSKPPSKIRKHIYRLIQNTVRVYFYEQNHFLNILL